MVVNSNAAMCVCSAIEQLNNYDYQGSILRVRLCHFHSNNNLQFLCGRLCSLIIIVVMCC